MFQRMPIVLILLAVTAATAAPAFATSHVLIQKSSKKGIGYVDLISALPLKHVYRIQVTGHKHSTLQGYGFENYSYVSRGRMQEGTTRLKFKGSIPKNFTLAPPVSQHQLTWSLGAVILTKDHQALKVKLVDLGRVR